MREIKNKNYSIVSGGNQDLYVPDPNVAMIAVGASALGGGIGGIPAGPVGMVIGGIAAGTASAVGVVGYDAYQINKSIEQNKSQ